VNEWITTFDDQNVTTLSEAVACIFVGFDSNGHAFGVTVPYAQVNVTVTHYETHHLCGPSGNGTHVVVSVTSDKDVDCQVAPAFGTCFVFYGPPDLLPGCPQSTE